MIIGVRLRIKDYQWLSSVGGPITRIWKNILIKVLSNHHNSNKAPCESKTAKQQKTLLGAEGGHHVLYTSFMSHFPTFVTLPVLKSNFHDKEFAIFLSRHLPVHCKHWPSLFFSLLSFFLSFFLYALIALHPLQGYQWSWFLWTLSGTTRSTM